MKNKINFINSFSIFKTIEFYAFIFFFFEIEFYISFNYFVIHSEARIPKCFEVFLKDPEIRHISEIPFTTFIFVGKFKEVKMTRLLKMCEIMLYFYF